MPNLINKIDSVILNIIILAFAIALVYFLYGVFEFVRNAEDPDARAKGAQSIMYGVIGMFIMIAVFAIISVVLGTFGITPPSTVQQY